MLTKPMDKDSRLLLLMMAADGIEATGRMLWRWWERSTRRGKLADQLRKFESAGLIASGEGALDARIFALTAAGHLRVWGEVDPESRWTRSWDGAWRFAMFDVPQAHVALRARLRRRLRELRFGWLQNSVWLSPDPAVDLVRQLASHEVSVESLLFVEGRPAAGESDADLVAGAWDFARLATMHASYLKLLRQRPSGKRITSGAGWAEWIDVEHRAWNALMQSDPLLPTPLLPAGYAGRKVWRARREALRDGARAMAEASASAS